MDDTTRGIEDPDAGGTWQAQPARGASSGSGRSTTKSKRAPGDEAGLDRDTDIRTRELQAEIADTREELSETVEAIQEKLRPSNIMSQGTEAVKTAATQRVRDMAESATDTAYRMVESTRQNPWPALLIGAGVAWLLIDRTSDREKFDNWRSQSPSYQPPRYGTTGRRLGRTDGEEDSSVYRESGGVRAYGEEIRHTARRAQTGLQRMLHENPLLVAAAAVLTGAAVGGALPQTEKENELMGEARDQVLERAQGAARDAADSVRQVANAVQTGSSQVSD